MPRLFNSKLVISVENVRLGLIFLCFLWGFNFQFFFSNPGIIAENSQVDVDNFSQEFASNLLLLVFLPRRLFQFETGDFSKTVRLSLNFFPSGDGNRGFLFNPVN